MKYLAISLWLSVVSSLFHTRYLHWSSLYYRVGNSRCEVGHKTLYAPHTPSQDILAAALTRLDRLHVEEGSLSYLTGHYLKITLWRYPAWNKYYINIILYIYIYIYIQKSVYATLIDKRLIILYQCNIWYDRQVLL